MRGRVYQRGKIWYVDYYVGPRRIRQSVGPDKRLAEAVLHKRLAEVAEGRHLERRPDGTVPFEEILQDYLEYSKINKRSYQRTDLPLAAHLLHFFREMRMCDITPSDIERFKGRRLSEGASRKEVNLELSLFRSACNLAVRNRKIAQSPMEGVRMLSLEYRYPRFLTSEEMARLVAVCREPLKSVVITALTTGMRRGEILSLRWGQVDLEAGILRLPRTKSGRPREIPISGLLKQTLLAWQRPNPSPDTMVFCYPDGRPIVDPKTAFRLACRRANIQNFRFHDLRHTAASWLVMEGVPLPTVMEMLGHSSIQMTMRYAHLSPDHKMEAAQKLASVVRKAMELANGHKTGTTMSPHCLQTDAAPSDSILTSDGKTNKI